MAYRLSSSNPPLFYSIFQSTSEPFTKAVLVMGLLLCLSTIAAQALDTLRVSSGQSMALLGSHVYQEVVVETTGVLEVSNVQDPKWAGRLELVANRLEVHQQAKVSASHARGNLPKVLETENTGGPRGGYGGKGGGPSAELSNPSYGDAGMPMIERGTYGTAGGGINFPGRPGGALLIRAEEIVSQGLLEANGEEGGNSSTISPGVWSGSSGAVTTQCRFICDTRDHKFALRALSEKLDPHAGVFLAP